MSSEYLEVVSLSSEHESLWDALAEDLSTKVLSESSPSVSSGVGGLAAILIAAAGEEGRAIDWLERNDTPSDVPVFVVGSEGGHRIAVRLLALGAHDYYRIPGDLELLRNGLASVLARRRNVTPPPKNKDTESPFAGIIGESQPLRAALQRAERMMPHQYATALITGETGTGKELLARAIHKGGPRTGAPFVALNCSSIPENLFESELFGHERGAFTDARQAKPGLVEVAAGGTLFLDEIGTLPVDLQSKLLRVLDDKEVRRVGGTKSRKIDVRVLAATNEDLPAAIEQRNFREDLYYRIGVITIDLPPLRDRGADVISVAEYLLEKLGRQYGMVVPEMTLDVKNALQGYSWPGNIRELKNSLERCLLLSGDAGLALDELGISERESKRDGAGSIPFPAKLSEITEVAARATLELCNGNRSEAARRLDISRRRLRRILDGNYVRLKGRSD